MAELRRRALGQSAMRERQVRRSVSLPRLVILGWFASLVLVAVITAGVTYRMSAPARHAPTQSPVVTNSPDLHVTTAPRHERVAHDGTRTVAADQPPPATQPANAPGEQIAQNSASPNRRPTQRPNDHLHLEGLLSLALLPQAGNRGPRSALRN